MTAEVIKPEGQNELGLVFNMPPIVRPLAEVRISEVPDIRKLSYIIADRYQQDVEAGWIDGDTKGRRERWSQWKQIAKLNPDYTGKVLAIGRAMGAALKGDYEISGPMYGFHDPIGEYFEEVENSDTKAVLRSVLRLSEIPLRRYINEDGTIWHVIDLDKEVEFAAEDIVDEIQDAFPNDCNKDFTPNLNKRTPVELFQLMLEVRLKLPGYIEYGDVIPRN